MRYVGQSDRHLITRFKEHRSAQPVAIHFAGCNLVVKEEDIVVLASTKKRMPHLYNWRYCLFGNLNTSLSGRMIFSKENWGYWFCSVWLLFIILNVLLLFSFQSTYICVYFICFRYSWWWSIGSKKINRFFSIPIVDTPLHY